MRFSKVFTFASLAFAASASPVVKRDQTGEIVGAVENLLGDLVHDIEGVAAAAGIDVNAILAKAGINLLTKREEEQVEVGERDVGQVVGAVGTLVLTLVADLLKLLQAAGLGGLTGLLNSLK